MKHFLAIVVLLVGWLSAPSYTQSPAGCPEGKVNSTCGSACPLTCENYQDPPACTEQCVGGCFCPQGQVEHGEGCVPPEECPVIECTNGKLHSTCGSACPLTCDNYRDPPACIQECVEGCFCPEGLLEHEGGCVAPEECGVSACSDGKSFSGCGTACPLTCDNYLNPPACMAVCVSGCFCPEGQVLGGDGSCVDRTACPGATAPPPPCAHPILHPNGSASCPPVCRDCRADQECQLRDGWAQCVNTPYVPCGRDVMLQCDSEYTHCLQQNRTLAASCVASCLSDNGGCDPDSVCVTSTSERLGVPEVQCLDTDDISRECPAGQVINQCGAYCQETCEQRVSGEQFACIEICGPPACVCPDGLLLYRDRCVDPRLCYVLVKYPPAINPLPLVGDSQFLYSLVSAGSILADFQPEQFLGAVRVLLTEHGYSNVEVELHGVYQDDDLQIVVLLSGDDLSEECSVQLISILEENSAQLPLTVSGVSLMDTPRVVGASTGSVNIWAVVLYTLIPAVVVVTLVVVLLLLGLVKLTMYKKKLKRCRRPDKLKFKVQPHDSMVSDDNVDSPTKDMLANEYIS